ncbi:MAG TPA: hypothetical protein VLV18_07365, partial [Terriglobales bacterium]|nr:hypothetical protein [Terriglobales bacterium]
ILLRVALKMRNVSLHSLHIQYTLLSTINEYGCFHISYGLLQVDGLTREETIFLCRLGQKEDALLRLSHLQPRIHSPLRAPVTNETGNSPAYS